MLDGRCFGALLVGLSVGCAYDFGVFDDGGGGASSTSSSSSTTSGESTTSSAMGGKGGGSGTGGALPKTCGNGVLDADEQCDDALEGMDHGLCDDCAVVCPTVDADGVDQFFDPLSRHCYVVYSNVDLGFGPAKAACSAWRPRARLVSITSDAEQNLVVSHLDSTAFLGAVYENNAWVWPNEGPMVVSYWQSGEPDGMACATVETDGDWDSHYSCDDHESEDVVCEWEPTKTPL